jgi:hypothetical protein
LKSPDRRELPANGDVRSVVVAACAVESRPARRVEKSCKLEWTRNGI